MNEIILKLSPIFIGFGLAFAIKKVGWVKTETGNLLLKAAFYVTIPALIVVSVSQIQLTRHLLVFPLLPAIILSVTFLITLPIAKRLQLPRQTEGTFRVAPLTINSAFTLPFLQAFFGGEGITRVVLFNAGFNPLLMIGVYGLAASYNPNSKGKRDVLKRILILPPLWALVIGLALNLSNTAIPTELAHGLKTVGQLTIALTIASLGILFNPQHLRLDKTMALLGLRMGLGLLIGLVVAYSLRLTSLDRAAVLAIASAPVGFNLLSFTVVENLDKELAANAVSLSMIFGLLLTPLILILS